MAQKFMVKKSGVEKFMVEKSGVERFGVERFGVKRFGLKSLGLRCPSTVKTTRAGKHHKLFLVLFKVLFF